MSAAAEKARHERRQKLAERYSAYPGELKTVATRARTQSTTISALIIKGSELLTPEQKGQLADAAILLRAFGDEVDRVRPMALRIQKEQAAKSAAELATRHAQAARKWLQVPEAQVRAAAFDLADVAIRFAGDEGRAWWEAQGHDPYWFSERLDWIKPIRDCRAVGSIEPLLAALGDLLYELAPTRQISLKSNNYDHLRRFWAEDIQRRAFAANSAPGHDAPEVSA